MSSSSPPQSTLGVLQPVGGGDPIPLLKTQLVVGRRESCDVCLRFSNISSKHCELAQVHGTWIVRDLNSTNGIKVNGERVQEKRLYPGDELEIANHRFRIEYIPSNLRSADAEVDELHEDLMRFSLMERAGLVKRTREETPARKAPKAPPQPNEKEASLDFIRALKSKAGDSGEASSGKAADDGSPLLDEEGLVEQVRPAAPLGNEEFLDLVTPDKAKKRRKKKE